MGAHETIVLQTQVDKTLVGGLTVQIGDKFMDLSISSKIASMKVCMYVCMCCGGMREYGCMGIFLGSSVEASYRLYVVYLTEKLA